MMVEELYKVLFVNKILSIHAAWLFENGYYEEYEDCLKQAKEYSQDKDLRQTNGYFKRLDMKALALISKKGVRARKLQKSYEFNNKPLYNHSNLWIYSVATKKVE